MAYAGLSSLMYTLEQLLKPNQFLICGSCTQHVESFYQSFCVLQVFLEDITKEAKDIETLKVIEGRIRDVIYKAEDKDDKPKKHHSSRLRRRPTKGLYILQ
ncbi:putative vinorine synthase-like [Capsicum annuum]|nr:putative vinorine synthase-like [Capsicum annuum]